MDYDGNIRQPTTTMLPRLSANLGISKEGRFSILPGYAGLGFSAHRGSAYFTDLDSCRELVECSEIEKPMQVMRDALSAVLYLIIIFLQEPYIYYFSPEQVFRANLQRTFLANYYCDLPIELINALVEVLNEYHLELYQRAMGSQEQSVQEDTDVPSDLPPDLAYQLNHSRKLKFWKSSWLNYEEIYCYLIAVMWLLHSRSQISAMYPFKLSEEQLYANMADFGTPQTVEKIRKKIDYAIGLSGFLK